MKSENIRHRFLSSVQTSALSSTVDRLKVALGGAKTTGLSLLLSAYRFLQQPK